MPSVSKGSKVLVSGANGYIAMWVVRTLLERGFTVRGTVRTEEKGKFLTAYFESLGYGDKFEVVIVDDIVKEGAFDEAVKGVDAIEHTASPCHLNAKTPEEFINPAVQGTLGMLKSASKNGSRVQRIVITSSCAAIYTPSSEPTVSSERDWSLGCIEEVRKLGNKSPAGLIYGASKTLAEKAAWDFYDQHKAQIKWDLVVINPPIALGPPIQELASPSSLNSSLQIWYEYIISSKTREALCMSNSWVDVRDTALGHVLALEKEAAGGERIITASEGFISQEWLDAASSLSPMPKLSHKIQRGYPDIMQRGGDWEPPAYMITYDQSKQAKILGIKFRTKLETLKDTLEDFARRGW